MKKIAIFLEGKCEQLFVEALIKTLAKTHRIHIEKIEASGSRGKRKFFVIEAKSDDDDAIRYYLLLYNCGGDKQVKSDIKDQYEGLKKAGYSKIIAIRDVYPDALFEELQMLRSGLMQGFHHYELPSVIFCLGVMEFEAWLIAEHTHFQRFNPEITPERIADILEFDIKELHYSSLPQPSKTLSDIYWLEKIPYDKSQATIDNILSAIDFKTMESEVCNKFEDLKNLYKELTVFFEST